MNKTVFLLILVNFIFSGCTDKNSQAEELIIDPVESMPSFKGGDDSLFAYLNKNNQWRVGQSTIEGKVFVGFTVNEKGELKNIEVKKSLCPTCNKEALRLIENMPNWKPARENGKLVSKRMVLPISFNGL